MGLEQQQPTVDVGGAPPHELGDLLKAMDPDERARVEPADDEQEEERTSHRLLLSQLLVPGVKTEDGDWQADASPVEFARVVNFRDGRDSYYVFTIVHPRTGDEVETRRIDAADLLTLSNLQEAVWAAASCLIASHRRNTPRWRRCMKAIEGAAEQREPPEPGAGDWAQRLESYLGERLTRDRDEAAARSQPFEEDGQAHVHRESFQKFVNRHLGLAVTKRQTQDALRDLGAQLVTVNYRLVDRGHERRKQRDYWRLPVQLTDALT
jgi:hypothetical protein